MMNQHVLQSLLLDITTFACTKMKEKTIVPSLLLREDNEGRWLLDPAATQQALRYVFGFVDFHQQEKISKILAKPRFAEVADVISQQLRRPQTRLKFYTSRCTGKSLPKVVIHTVSDLNNEAKQWLKMIPKVSHITSCVSSYQIFGFIGNVLCAKHSCSSFTDARLHLLSSLECQANTLLLATPSMFNALMSIPQESKRNTHLVLSTQACNHSVLKELKASGFAEVWQIYGTTETGGIGYRTNLSPRYHLRSDLCRDGQKIRTSQGKRLIISDDLRFGDDMCFEILNRSKSSPDEISVNRQVLKSQRHVDSFYSPTNR